MTLANLFLIGFIVVFIIDYSGFIEEADKILTKALKSKYPLHIPKPFSCSLCSTFWLGLIYLLCVGQFNLLNIAGVIVVSAFTPEILSIIYFAKDFINMVFDEIEKFLGMIK